MNAGTCARRRRRAGAEDAVAARALGAGSVEPGWRAGANRGFSRWKKKSQSPPRIRFEGLCFSADSTSFVASSDASRAAQPAGGAAPARAPTPATTPAKRGFERASSAAAKPLSSHPRRGDDAGVPCEGLGRAAGTWLLQNGCVERLAGLRASFFGSLFYHLRGVWSRKLYSTDALGAAQFSQYRFEDSVCQCVLWTCQPLAALPTSNSIARPARH